MSYNDDAREPSSVTGRALGALALVAATGATAFGATKAVRAVGKGAKTVGKKAKEFIDENSDDIAAKVGAIVGGKHSKKMGEDVLDAQYNALVDSYDRRLLRESGKLKERVGAGYANQPSRKDILSKMDDIKTQKSPWANVNIENTPKQSVSKSAGTSKNTTSAQENEARSILSNLGSGATNVDSPLNPMHLQNRPDIMQPNFNRIDNTVEPKRRNAGRRRSQPK